MNTKTTFFATIAATLVISMALTPAFAAIAKDPEGDFIDLTDINFDIKKIGIDDDGNPYVDVYGKAGATTAADDGPILAVLIETDDGTYVIASHDFCDSNEQPACNAEEDDSWHAHKVTAAGQQQGCVATIDDSGEAILQNKRYSVSGTSATTVISATTAQLGIVNSEICPLGAYDTVPNP